MRELIWIVSVLVATLCSFCLAIGMFFTALPSTFDQKANTQLVLLVSIVIWGVGTLVMWWVLFHLTDRLVKWISRPDTEKKKKRPPQISLHGEERDA